MMRKKLPARPPAGAKVFLAVREIRTRHMTSRVRPLAEAELRVAVADAYVAVSRVQRATRALAAEAAEAQARRRGWEIAGTKVWGPTP